MRQGGRSLYWFSPARKQPLVQEAPESGFLGAIFTDILDGISTPGAFFGRMFAAIFKDILGSISSPGFSHNEILVYHSNTILK